MKSDDLKLYTNCIPVKGYLRSVIQDIQRGSFNFVPNLLIDCMSESNYFIKSKNVDEETFNNYKKFLLSEDLVFEWEMSLAGMFPKYKDVFYHSYHIYSTHFVGISDLSILKKMLTLLKQGLIVKHFVFELGECCVNLLDELIDLLNTDLKDTTIESVCLRLTNDFGVKNYFSSKSNIDFRINVVEVGLLKSEDESKSFENIQILSLNERNPRMINNFLHYFESTLFHTYYNRKLFINSQGFISNQQEDLNYDYSINDFNHKNKLLDIIQSEFFNKLSRARKVDTVVCKSCELRHMCLDKRLPKQNSKGNWYHTVECDYNPYIAKWKGEEGYKTLAECGVISNESEFTIDHDKIAEINKELWPEE